MTQPKKIKLVECPRDAMQGWKHIIPTEKKIAYINALLKVGFDTIDFGSFVSPKAIPQMADTAVVLKGLNVENSKSKLLAIIANVRGAEDAVVHDAITYLGFPFSISPTFQQRNTNSTIQQSVERVEEIQNLCIKNQKKLVVYISMGFGNPYGDEYNQMIVLEWVHKMVELNIEIISIADTVGLATPHQVHSMLQTIVPLYPHTQIGVHLHSTTTNWKQKMEAALQAGCTRFDGALKGIGGCPMADDELVGNMDTELMIPYLQELHLLNTLDRDALDECSRMATEIFV
jgi:hydroxymethylglutaryl-CoA lyase